MGAPAKADLLVAESGVHGALWERGLLVLGQFGGVVMLALRAIGRVGLPDLGALVLRGPAGRGVLAPQQL